MSGGAGGGMAGAGGGTAGAGGGVAGAGGGTAGAGGAGGAACGVPATFAWSTPGPVLSPKSDAKHNLVAIKDPSVVYFNSKWHVFVSTVDVNGAYSMAYITFPDWDHAADATFYYLDQTPTLVGYHTSPEIFFFAPQSKWYLVFQSGQPQYSTNTDIDNPAGWTQPQNFYATEPTIVTQTAGANGGWLDFWVICDDSNCYLFFDDDAGHYYRGQTTVANFPSGFGAPVVVLTDATNPSRIFEASNVYKLSGTSKYLAVIEAFDSDSSYKRYYRSWTADTLDGAWTPLADTFVMPFAATSDTTFTSPPAWTQDISSGEMIRNGYDQHLTVDPCHLQYVYQGVSPASTGLPYNSLPWQVGLLTKTN
jgi:endo-1,4-beta-xylanase